MIELIYSFLKDRQLFSREDFCARLAVPVLLFKRAKPVRDDVRLRTLTQTHDAFAYEKALSDMGRAVRSDAHQFRVFRLTPERGAVVRKIGVGRSKTNQIVVNDSAVSKLHAVIEIRTTSEIFITDLKSKNGTRVDTTRIPGDTKYLLKAGQTLHFGNQSMRLLSPSAFFDALTDMSVPKPEPKR